MTDIAVQAHRIAFGTEMLAIMTTKTAWKILM
jgi:hypothetical protein